MLEHHRDLAGRRRSPLPRRILLAALSAILVLGLANVFGQHPSTSRADARAAGLEVEAPRRLRGGLLFQAKVRVVAHEDLAAATVVLDPGWLENTTLNTIEPGPARESSRDGGIALELGRLAGGEEHLLYLEFQVNPTAVGRRSQDVELFDGERPIASVRRAAFIWP